MGGTLEHPTLVVGLGGFGREVAALLLRQSGGAVPGNLVVLQADPAPERDGSADPPAPDVGERVVDDALAAARRLLDLKHRVETTASGDSRPPRVDVFLVADLSQPGVASLVPGLAGRLGARLRDVFRPIFIGTGGRLTLCPVLAMPRVVRGRAEVREAIDALDALSRDADERRRPLAPIYLVEDQTARYVLSPEELVRTVAAWLHLVLYSGLRDHEDALKAIVEQDGDGRAPFASFACATLEFDTRPLTRYCTGRLALEVLEALLDDRDNIADVDAVAQRLSPEGTSLQERLAKGRNDKPIADELRLEKRELELADPAWDDSPEAVRALADPYVARVLASGENQRQRIEGFKMESAARLVDEGGLAILQKAERDVDAEIARCLGESPSGLESARARMVALEARLGQLEKEARRAIDRPELPPLPEGKGLKSAHEAVVEEIANRPRLGRMITWGAISAALMAVFMTAVLRFFWRLSVSAGFPLMATGVEPEDGGRFLAGYPWAALWSALVAGVWHAWALAQAYRGRHQKLLNRFADLRRAAREHFGELERYYARRVAYSQALWTARIERHLHERVQGERALLEAARTALQRVRERIADEVRAEAGASTDEAGVLFRGLLTGEDMAAIYAARAKPQNPGALALRYVAEVGASGSGWRGGGFAQREALVRFAAGVCPDLSTVQPFSDGAEWAGPARLRATEFLRQLAGKLTLPVELGVDTSGRADAYVSYVPAECRDDVGRLLQSEDLARRWSVRECSDPRRMHLFIATRGIRRDALKLLESEAEGAR